MRTVLLLLLLLACQRPPDMRPPTEPPGIDDVGVVDVVVGAPEDGGVELLRASATVFHWNTAWNEPAAQSIARPMIDRFLQTRVGVVLLEHEWPGQDSPTAPTDEVANAFYDQRYRTIVGDVLGHGGTVLFQLVGPPLWASSTNQWDPIIRGQKNRPVWSVSPPAFDPWRSAVTTFARWLAANYATELANGRLLLMYGAELENEEFSGDLRHYADAWKVFSDAVRAVDARFQVGGGGRLDVARKSQPSAYRTTEPALTIWLRNCKYADCRIDFIAGHHVTMSPIGWADDTEPARDDFAVLSDQIDHLTAPEGYRKLPIVITDWTSWEFKDRSRSPWLSSEHDTEYRAAHLTASLAAMRRAGYKAQTQGALFETVSTVYDEFSGDWGLFSRRGITKASFHATALASRLTDGQALEVKSSDRFVSGLATTRAAETRLLVTRFVPDTERGGRMLAESLGTRLSSRWFDETKLATFGCPLASLTKLVTTLDRSQCAAAMPPLSTTLDAWFELVNTAKNEPVTRTVRLRLPWRGATASLTVAHVDATRSNAASVCVGGAECTDIAGVNAGAGALVEEPVPVTVSNGFVDVQLVLNRRHVVLLTLKP